MPFVERRSGRAILLSLSAAALLALSMAPVETQEKHETPQPLAIGSPAPDFSLRGIDGRTYTLDSFRKSPLLAVVFTAVHCPTAEVYEERLKSLVHDYRGKGVAFAVIQPNNAKALRLDEMGYTDLGDSLEDMKVRAAHRRFNFPFLYDGETQAISRRYGPVATPHLFLFDKDRTLRYHGRLDSNPREALATIPHARNAMDAVLAGKPVEVEKTPAIGCSVKWLEKSASHDAEQASFAKEPVPLEKITVDQMKELRKNATGKTLLVNFWATWCGPCVEEFPDLQNTWRMYRKRPFELVTVAVNYPDEEVAVRKFLDGMHASTKNYLPAAMDPSALVQAFDPEWNGGVPYSIVIGPDGNVLYKSSGRIDVLKARRTILASFPDDDYVGQNAYWNRK